MTFFFDVRFAASSFTPTFGHSSRAARLAARLARVAHPPAVQDQPVAERGPLRLRDQLHQGELDLHRVVVLGQAEPAREPADVRVDRDARRVEGVAEDDVRGLAADAGQRDEIVERCGTSPPNRSTMRRQQARMFFALFRKKPVDLMSASQLRGVGSRQSRGPSGSGRTGRA